MTKSNGMFATMYEVKKDSELGKYLVCPLGTEEHLDYAIVCNSEFDAKNICAQIAMQMLATPEESPLKYNSKGIHSNGRTRLYSLK
ncbi:hypothetical protein A9Q84_00690 [Halobacteriovorax marinus]|uniref:Uncharacterized protein n=1 Tax=Halobacteriovorax marinus TaxID=97084 RepID=A0A1Y5FC27_9BACT|nr:hypothetical protein A9Q84_00690 [Halobacteriovorax marinus]